MSTIRLSYAHAVFPSRQDRRKARESRLVQQVPGAAKALYRSVEMGNPNAGALLLLGYATNPQEAIPCLQRPFPKGARVKLVTSSKPVSAQFAARVALARLGDAKAIEELRSAFSDKTHLWETLFLLAVLADIQDRESLSAAVAGHLSDKRVCPGVVAHATRQVRDVALEALVSRLGIEKLQFQVEPGKRYSDREIEEVRPLALARIRALP